MPEGPSIVLVREELMKFKGKKVLDVTGNTTTIRKELLENKILRDVKTWGKHLLLCFPKFTVRIHFMMFGSYSIEEKKDRLVRLGLKFRSATVYFYTCSVRMIEAPLDEVYDWSADVMNDDWNPKAAKKKLKALPHMLACDALLEQDIFSGVGNIIKNEILYRVRVHPESVVEKVPARVITKMITEARRYSFQFLEWKRQFILKKQWLAHTKKTCLRCNLPFKRKHTGSKKRRSFFCTNCQKLYV